MTRPTTAILQAKNKLAPYHHINDLDLMPGNTWEIEYTTTTDHENESRGPDGPYKRQHTTTEHCAASGDTLTDLLDLLTALREDNNVTHLHLYYPITLLHQLIRHH